MRSILNLAAVLSIMFFLSCRGSDPEIPSNTTAEMYFTLDSTAVGISTVATGLDVPWEITWGSDNWIWMTQQKGIISKLNPRTGQKLDMLKLEDVYLRTTPGLLGMDLHPDQENFPYIFILYNSLQEEDRIVLNLVRYTVRQDTLDDPRYLLEIPGGRGHNGSRVKISPDGKVIIATGEGGDAEKAQDIRSLGGKILRLNIDGSIPEDNPFQGSPVWSWGHRNQQGLTYSDRGILYASEHGQATDDEVNIIEKGNNYGWPDVEGYCDRPDEKVFCADSSISEPLKSWTPTIAPAGIDYYGSDEIPEWQNTLLLTTLKDASLHVLPLQNEGMALSGNHIELEKIFGRLRDVSVSPEGEVYIATSNRDWKPQENFPIPEDDRILRLFRIPGEGKPDGIKSLQEMVSDSLESFSNKLSRGALIYQKHCASCHMPSGEGIPGTFPPLQESPAVVGDKESLVTTVLTGIPASASRSGTEYPEAMPAFNFLSDEEIAQILTYVRTRLGNNASAVTTQEVEHVRKNSTEPDSF